MPLLARGSSVMRNLFRRERVDQDLDAEIRSYFDTLVEEKLAAGMPPDEARRAAAIEVGGIEQVKERVRETRTGALLQDLRYGLRTLAKNPGFTAAAVVTLGLGIGANTAIFSVVNGVLLSPLAGRDPDRLVLLWESTKDTPQIPVSYPNYLDWRQRTRSFEDIAAFNGFDQFTMTGQGDPERVHGGLASGNLFTVFGVEPAAGRLLAPRDDRPEADPVAVISDEFWQRRFGADRQIVGKTIVLDGNPYTIVGVMPPNFRIIGSEVLIPLGRFTHTPRFVRSNHGLIGIGRLKPNVTIDQMLADLGAVARQLQREYPADNAGIGAAGEPLKERLVGGIRQPLRVLAIAVGLVLLVACANVANLLLSRAAARQHEFALRVAIGAGRRRVVRQLITESLILAVAGGVLGLGLAWAGVKLLVTLRPDNVPRLLDIHVDATVLAFALGLSLVTGFLFGLAPALQLARSEPILALQEGGGGRTGGGRARRRVANGLTVAEVAVALVLLVGAGLLLRSFAKLTSVDPGFDPRNVTAAQVSLPEQDYPDEARRRIALRELLRRVRALPQARDSALATDLPVSTNWQTQVTFEGLPPVSPGSEPLLDAVIVSPEYFHTMRIRLLAGRGIEDTDAKEQPLVVAVSESVAKRYFGGRRALGQRMKQGGVGLESPWLTIVGIVADVKN